MFLRASFRRIFCAFYLFLMAFNIDVRSTLTPNPLRDRNTRYSTHVHIYMYVYMLQIARWLIEKGNLLNK